MTTVTAYTKERMDEIVDNTIVGASLDEVANLIFERYNETTFNAGNLSGEGTVYDKTIEGLFADRPAAGTANLMYYATDQGIKYRDNGSSWKRMTGDPNQIWVTDYGAVPGTNTAPVAAANTTAFNTAIAAARLSATRNAAVYVPMLLVGAIYYTDAPLVINNVDLIGSGNIHGGFARTSDQAGIQNITAGSGAIVVNNTVAGIGAQSTLKNLFIQGDEYAFYVSNRSGVKAVNCTFYCNITGTNNNAAIVLENSFWLTFNTCQTRAGTVTPTHAWNRGPCGILMIASEGGPIRGIGQTTFKHMILNVGGIRFENRSTGSGNDSAGIAFVDVVTENQGPQAFFQFVVNGGTAPHIIRRIKFDRCERADGAGTGTNPAVNATTAFYIDANNVVSGATISDMENPGSNYYTQWLFQCVNKGDIQSFNSANTGAGSGLAFDPSNLPFNKGFGSIVRTPNAPLTVFLQDKAVSLLTLAPSSGGGVSSVFSVTIDPSQAKRRFGLSGRGDMIWSDGTNLTQYFDFSTTPGTALFKALASNIANINIDNSDGTVNSCLNFLLNGVQKWKVYVPGSSTELRFNSGSDKLRLEAGGRLKTFASASASAGLNLPHGAAPTSPVDGDMWTTTAGLYVQINGSTVGPLS